jgi:hypothetical protein
MDDAGLGEDDYLLNAVCLDHGHRAVETPCSQQGAPLTSKHFSGSAQHS